MYAEVKSKNGRAFCLALVILFSLSLFFCGSVRAEEVRVCCCGCGQIVKAFGRKYAPGHNPRSHHNIAEYNKQHGHDTYEQKYGKKKAKELREWRSRRFSGKNNPFYGKKHSEEAKRIIGLKRRGREPFNKGKTWEEVVGVKRARELKKKIRQVLKGIKPWNTGKHWTEEQREKFRLSRIGLKYPESHNKKIARASKRMWRDKRMRELIIKNTLKALRKRPTSFEQRIIDLGAEYCEHLLNKYGCCLEYVGDGKVLIAGKNPDFVLSNGYKGVLEVYSRYWKNCGPWKDKNYEKERAEQFAKYDYKVLFLNEDDLDKKDWEEHCLDKIENFIGGLSK